MDTPNASGGSYLYASSPNDTLTLDFYGTSIEVIYVEDPSFGSFTVEIDNTAVRTVAATGSSTVFGVTADFTDLSDSTHTLRIIGIQGTVAIDAFVATDFTHPWQTYNDDHVDLLYHANSWTHETLTGASGGTVATTSERGSMLTFFIEGTGVELVYTADENGGPFAVYVDFVTRYAGDSTTLSSQTGQTLTITGLADGTHRIEVLKGQNTLRLEAIRVQGQLVSPPYELPPSQVVTGFQTESIQPPTGSCDYSPTTTAALISAINSANAGSGHDTICLSNGQTYIVEETYTDDWSGKNAFPVLTSSITIDGNGATIRPDIFTQGANSDFRFFYIDLGAEVTIEGLTLQYGDPESLVADNSGGAIYNVGELHLLIVTLNYNTTEDNGGAIMNGGDLSIGGSDIYGNVADGSGGAIYNLGGDSIQITNTDIFLNRAATGGAIYADFGGTTTIQNTLIENNYTTSTIDGFGGAFRIYHTSFNISNTSIGDNDAYNGGAVYAELQSNYFTIANSCIYGNADTSVANDVYSLEDINAANNWWGTSDGPSGMGPGSGDSITLDVNYGNFLSTPYFGCRKIPPACTAESSGYQTESSGVPGGNLDYCIPQITPTPFATNTSTATSTPSPTTTVVFPGTVIPNAPPPPLPSGQQRCVLQVLDGETLVFYATPQEAVATTQDPLKDYYWIIGDSNLVTVLPIVFWEANHDVVLVRHWDDQDTRQWGWINGLNVVQWIYEATKVVVEGETNINECAAQYPKVTDTDLPAQPTSTPTPTPTGPTPTVTLTPTVTPTLTPQALQNQLGMYNVYVAISSPGNPTVNIADPLHVYLLREVLQGVEDISLALNRKYPNAAPGDNEIDTFRTVMFDGQDPIAFVFYDRQPGSGNMTCQTHNDWGAATNAIPVLNANLTAAGLSYNGYQAIVECDIDLANNYPSTPQNPSWSKYTAVHELGHVFTGTMGGLVTPQQPTDPPTFFSLVEDSTYPQGNEKLNVRSSDDTGSIILGRLLQRSPFSGRDEINWTRGGPITGGQIRINGVPYSVNGVPNTQGSGRGWGSSARIDSSGTYGLIIVPQPACDFQQNPSNMYGLDEHNEGISDTLREAILQEKIQEAAADLFLNWVYENLGQSGLGFENLRWIQNAVNCNTSSHGSSQIDAYPSGDTLFLWVDGILHQLGDTNNRGWN